MPKKAHREFLDRVIGCLVACRGLTGSNIIGLNAYKDLPTFQKSTLPIRRGLSNAVGPSLQRSLALSNLIKLLDAFCSFHYKYRVERGP